jgi:hypothetical protein
MLLALFVLPNRVPTVSTAQSPLQSQQTIAVSGRAEVKVAPDEVTVVLGVQTSDEDLLTAKRLNDDRVKAILKAVTDLGVKPQHIQTDFISIEPRYSDTYTESGFVGYFVRKTVVVTLKDVSKFEGLLTNVLIAGDNYVHGIEFRTTELRKYRDQARALAIKAAREKAEALGGELSLKVGRAVTIYEDAGGSWVPYGSWWGGGYRGAAQNVIQNSGSTSAPAEDSAIALGQMSVLASVGVTFHLEPQ